MAECFNLIYLRDHVTNVPIIQLDDLQMFYAIDGAGVCMVFIHQVATDHRLWRNQHNYFSSRYRIISIDALGHGQIQWPQRELSIERGALRIRQLLIHLETGPVFIIGASMGAALAMRVALDAPALVYGLVLVNPWHYVNDHMKSLVDRLLLATEAKGMTAYMNVFLRYALPSTDEKRYLPKAELLRALGLAQNPKTVTDAWTACLAFDVRHQLREIRTPSLVVAGMHDLFTPPYLARSVVDGLPIKELEVWEGHAHFPFLEDSERFNRRLETFILSCIE